MIIGIPKESAAGETRVAMSPDTTGRLKGKGFSVLVETGAGAAAHFSDEAFIKAGAEIAGSVDELHKKADIIAKIQPPTLEELDRYKENSILVSMLKPFQNPELLKKLAARKISAFSLEMVPRITRAQSMDILSSQANLAGYKAVIMAADHYNGLFPMFMTAAGTVRAARVMVIGAGVAGLQAIATAKRLGAVVCAFDIRAAVKEEIQSLGAKFVEIDLGIGDASGSGGYARELTPEERQRQSELLGKEIEKQDIVITTAAVPGKASPKLIMENTIRNMKHGSVIVDLAAEGGGNTTLTKPGEVVNVNGVTIIGTLNLPALLSTEASNLYARNVMNFLVNMQNKEGVFAINTKDEVVAGSLITHEGAIVHPKFV